MHEDVLPSFVCVSKCENSAHPHGTLLAACGLLGDDVGGTC